MPRYLVTRKYQSHIGSFQPGEEVELDAETFDWLKRDAPGAFMEMEDRGKADPVEPEVRTLDAPPADRMVRQARRRDRQGDPGDQGPITKETFKAVKD